MTPQPIFNQAWTLSAVKEFDKNDESGFFSNMYNLYNGFMVLGTSLIIFTAKILASILYAKDFYVAWKYVPFLTMASMFGAISGYFGGVFAAVKDTKVFGNTTIIGAAVNTALNFLLVYLMGPMGAAIATVASYFLVWILRLRALKRYINFRMNVARDCTSYIFLLIETLVLLCVQNRVVEYACMAAIIVLIIIFYKDEIMRIVRKFVKRN